uniref:BZIP domain-containing protein n=1 Tax=Toxocara canis TaxID=6265 RepID=A0A183U1U2_TOXCA
LPSGSAMDMDLLYQRDVPLKSEEDETNMDIDDDTTSQQRSVVVDPTKKSKKTGVSQKVEQVLPKSLKITGNVQLNRCIKKVLKRQRKRNKKIARKADALAESMDMAAIEDKQESFNF